MPAPPPQRGPCPPPDATAVRALLDATDEILLLLDLGGEVVEANRAACDALGCERGPLLGRPLWEAGTYRDVREAAPLQERIADAAAGGEVECALPCVGAGSEDASYVDLRLAPVRDASGRVIRVTACGSTARARTPFARGAVSGAQPGAPMPSAGPPAVGSGAEGASVAHATSPDAQRPLVLVVENDRIIRALLARALGARFRVAMADDGAIGLARALEEPPDLILTDLRMPNMDGEELVREVRCRSRLEGVPIMVLTAWADEDVRVRLLEHGALDFLAKPFSVTELLWRVHNLVWPKRAREMLQNALHSRERDLEALTGELVLRKRQLETSLESLRIESARAEAASRARNDFLGLMSHELMSPLTALELGCRCLERDQRAPLRPEHLALVQRMMSACRRLSGTLGELLEHVRLESERLSPGREAIDLAALAREVLDEASTQAAEKGLELRLAVDSRLPLAHGDAHLFRLVLTSLVSNAVKFTKRGSVVVSIEYRDGAHRLSVEDTGPGIPLHERSRVFEPFQHLERLSHKHVPGIGLGLTLARRAATVLGATIDVDTRLGSGTTFTLVTPARAAAPPGAAG